MGAPGTGSCEAVKGLGGSVGAVDRRRRTNGGQDKGSAGEAEALEVA